MPRLKFIPMYEGADIEVVYLGNIQVGRVSKRGRSGRNDGKGSWIFFLPRSNGTRLSDWREEKSHLAARNAILAATVEWMRDAGLIEAESPTEPASDSPAPAAS